MEKLNYQAAPSWVGSLEESLQKKVFSLKKMRRDSLFKLGKNGFNNHLLGVANSLAKELNEEEVVTILTTAGTFYHRSVEDREIERVVTKAFREGSQKRSKAPKWPVVDEKRISEIVKESPLKSLQDFIDQHPSIPEETQFLSGLFGDHELICVSNNCKTAHTQPCCQIKEWGTTELQFIVPSPMTAEHALTQDGNGSQRTLNNTGVRRFLVIEFDEVDGRIMSKDEQAILLDHLSQFAPLVMVLSSGNKSLHGWFSCFQQTDEAMEPFMRYAASLGADKAMWTKCQFARFPGGTRDNGKEQQVYVYRPNEAYKEQHDLEPLEDLLDPCEALPFQHISEIEPCLEANNFVEDLLTIEASSVIYGGSGSGKTFFVLDIAASVAMGKPWNGKEVKQGAVLYICLEGEQGFRNRIEALRQEGLLDCTAPFHMVTVPIDLLKDERKISKTVKQASKGHDFCFVIIDTLSRAIAGANENASEDMMLMIKSVDFIRKNTNAHVCLIHHTGKDAERGARGSSAIKAAIDTEIRISKEKDIIIATVTKQKDLEAGACYPFQLSSEIIGFSDDSKPVTSCLVQHLDASALPQPKAGAKEKVTPEDLLAVLPVDNNKKWKESAMEAFNISHGTYYKKKKLLIKGDHYDETPEGIIAL